MLKLRVLTALILIILLVFSVFYLPTSLLAILLGIFLLLGLNEWFRLVGFQRFPSFSLLAGSCLAFLLITFFLIPFLGFIIGAVLKLLNIHFSPHFSWVHIGDFKPQDFIAIVSIIWIGALIAVITFPKYRKFYTQGRFGLTLGFFVLVPTLVSFLILHHKAPIWVLYPLILVWVADIVAFFVGRSFGKHKLAPSISPGKTWEGVLGAFVGGTIIAIAGYYFLDIHFKLWIWMLINLMLISFSIIGDLFESIFKRVQGLKDSGRLLPGHGGILDRIDSLTAVLPLFVAAMLLLGEIKF